MPMLFLARSLQNARHCVGYSNLTPQACPMLLRRPTEYPFRKPIQWDSIGLANLITNNAGKINKLCGKKRDRKLSKRIREGKDT